MKCYNHEDREATEKCTSCNNYICNGCAVEINSKVICKLCVQNQLNKNTDNNRIKVISNRNVISQTREIEFSKKIKKTNSSKLSTFIKIVLYIIAAVVILNILIFLIAMIMFASMS